MIALSRFNTEISDKETEDPEDGSVLENGLTSWTGVRYLEEEQVRKLAEECVKQVKLRGPFLNMSEFINRRLAEKDEDEFGLGLMGALQAAIDYDDETTESGSINYRYKNGPDYMLEESDLADLDHDYATPEAAIGSRYAGIPGYIIQSDLLKPISNSLTVRDDTFRIRTYGDSRDANGNILARAWCEAIVQRYPEYVDGSNNPEDALRELNEDGEYEDSGNLSVANEKFGRRFRIVTFRWLCVFTWDPRYNRISFHGITCPVAKNP